MQPPSVTSFINTQSVQSVQSMKPLLISLLILSPFTALAADFAAPGAGSMLQQLQPTQSAAPSSGNTGLTIEQKNAGQLPPSAPFTVKTLLISGNEKIDTKTLHALVADAEGQTITLPRLTELAARITGYYRDHGYPLARAFIPAQTIQSGIVRIEVMEARYGKIQLDNRSQVGNALLDDMLAPLQNEQTITQADLERSLLLLSDIPGVATQTLIKPGRKVGTSDLSVNAASTPPVSGNLTLDGYGNRYTGRPRVSGTVNWINPLHHGDILSLSGLSSGEGVNYGRLSYESLLNGHGTRLGASYLAMRYELGDSLSSLNAHGTAQAGSVWAKQPLIRSRDFNVYGQIAYERTELRDRVDAGDIRAYRHLDNGSLSLFGDARDTLLSGGVNTWSLSWTAGQVSFDNSEADLADKAIAKTQGTFSKWNTGLSRLQNLTERDGLYLAFVGQWALDNLDPSNKMIVGGPYTVRGYDMGAVSGDTAYIGTAELRHDLGANRYGQWQAVAFVDSAYVQVNQHAWTAGKNNATLSGAGAGLNWLGPKMDWAIPSRLNARAYVATPIGPTPELVGTTNSVRAWLEMGMGF
jgi:hemolysin activation/secretion protein